MTASQHSPTGLIDAALRLLGIDRLALAIHDQSFPSLADEETGRGSPYSRGGLAFAAFARSLGFTTLQLGPQGKTSAGNPSPYDSTIFSRNILNLAPRGLARDDRLAGIFAQEDLAEVMVDAPRTDAAGRVDYGRAFLTAQRLLDRAYERFCRSGCRAGEAAVAFARFAAAQRSAAVNWIERDGLFEVLAAAAGTDDWRAWHGKGLSPLDRRLYAPAAGEARQCALRRRRLRKAGAAVIERFELGQFLLHRQHESLRRELRRLGMTAYGDLQVGLSLQDQWAWRELFLPGYLLGAPPSRTNRDGQPWGYPVLHPGKLAGRGRRKGPALQLMAARARKLFTEFDGLRIDHPQGIVCPWVYRADDPDPYHAVQNGARLYSSPDLPDHPALASFSLVPPEGLHPDSAYPRYGDEQVRRLAPDEIDRFAVVLDELIGQAEAAGKRRGDILCEVLSTWPAPLKAVMRQRGLGRFCITQKADPADPTDIYRSENTAPGDWIMVGTHDTKPLWLLVRERRSAPWLAERAALLARRLEPEDDRRRAFADRLASDAGLFCQAMFAELFLGPARNVSVFFADLLGLQETYNEPGTTGERNWSLRVPRDYPDRYRRRAERLEALHMPCVLSLALRARASELGPNALDLARRLCPE